MKVLITGAAGFIGSHTCERLVARGHEVVGIDSFDSYLYPAQVKRDNARALRATLDPTRFSLTDADICDESAVTAVVSAHRPDVICHLAALAGVRPSLDEPLRYMRTNIHGTTVVLEACRRLGVDRLVFASSSSVYGVRARDRDDLESVLAFRERDACVTPASPYAASKRAGELLCSTYRDLFGIGVSALRFFTVYGPRQRPDMAIHRFTRSIAQGAPLTMFGDGTSRRDYTYIDDIVSGVVNACERISAGAYRVYNLGGTTTIALADVIALIARTVGKPADIVRVSEQPGDVPITFADIENSARDLDYQPTIDIQEGIGRFWAWLREQP